MNAHAAERPDTTARADTRWPRTPTVMSHPQYMALRGLVPRLRARNMHAAGEALESVLGAYEAMRDGGFLVVQECELARAAAAGVPAVEVPRRRWWRFGR